MRNKLQRLDETTPSVDPFPGGDAQTPGEGEGDQPAPERRFRVELKHGLVVEVQAHDEADAWEVYKASQNITASDHTPSVVEIRGGD